MRPETAYEEMSNVAIYNPDGVFIHLMQHHFWSYKLK